MKQSNRRFAEKALTLTLLCLICLSLSIIPCMSLSDDLPENENLVYDPEFELKATVYNGNPAAFTVTGWTTLGNAQTVNSTQNSHIGETALQLTYDTADGSLAAGQYPSIWQDINVTAHTDYELTMYVKRTGDAAVSPLYVGYRNPNAIDKFINVSDKSFGNIGSSYEKITFSFNTDTLTVIRISAFAVSRKTGQDGQYYIDSVSLCKVKEEPYVDLLPKGPMTEGENLLVNSSFESGTVNAMTDPAAVSYGWTSVSVVGSDSFSGNPYCYTGKSNAFMAYSAESLPCGDYPTLYQDVRVEKNTCYELSFYVRKYGNAEQTPALYYGVRDPSSSNVWEHTEKFEVNEFGTDYTKVSCIIGSDEMSLIRIAFYTTALDYSETQALGGYHIDDIRLFPLSTPSSVSFTVEGQPIVGHTAQLNAFCDFENGSENIPLNAGKHIRFTYESDDKEVICGTPDGRLIARAQGRTDVRLCVDFCGKKVTSSPLSVTVAQNNVDVEPYIESVDAFVMDDISLTKYAQISLSARLSDGTYAKLGGCTIDVSSSNESIVYVKMINSVYHLIGIHGGEAEVYITVTHGDSTNMTYVNVTVPDGGYLYDSSFEAQNDLSLWKVETNCGTDLDDGLSNKLAHSGYANFWAAAPVSWDSTIEADSSVRISQKVRLKAGTYDLSAYINRFFATSVSGQLAACGGIVKIGAVMLDGENETETVFSSSFGTSYGYGGYQKLSTVFTAEEGEYLVFISIQGDETYGLGMQIDDVTLKNAKYPVSVTAAIGNDGKMEEGDLSKVVVTAHYADGTSEVLEQNPRIIVSDYGIAYVSGGFIIARADGSTEIKVISKVLDKTYQSEFTLNVGTASGNTENNQKGCNGTIMTGSGLLIAVCVATCAIAIRKTKHGGENEE